MCNWDTIYSVLKMTRESKDNQPMESKERREYIASFISISDIENMSKKDLQEGLITYLETVIPELRR